MSIAQFDDELDRILNDFYEHVISTSIFKSILNTQNLIDKEKDIYTILLTYFKSTDFKFIKKFVTDEQSIKLLMDNIKKYVAYYMFIFLGYMYDGKNDIFKNNVVEISNSHNKQKLDIDDFFISESNANIFNLVELSNMIYLIIETKVQKTKNNKQIYDDAQKIIDELGDKFIKNISKTSKQKNISQAHNIVKNVLLQKMYKMDNRKNIIKILETSVISSNESIYITIVVPTEKSVDLIEIESMLTTDEINQGVAKNIYDIIVKGEQYFKQIKKTNDDKIIELINSELLIPISEDFMLYHKDDNKYEHNTVGHDKEFSEISKIKYVIDKINNMENYYSPTVDKKRIDEIFNVPMSSRMAITINENEDIKIINKTLSIGVKGNENNDLFADLIHYRKYPYINFKSFSKDGFSLIFDKTKTILRAVSLSKEGITKQSMRNLLQIRIGSKEQQVNIVGFMLNPNKIAIECLRVEDIKYITYDYDNFYSQISNYILTGKSDIVVWLFDVEKNKTKIETYEQYDKIKQQEQCKNICASLYDNIIDIVYEKIINILNNFKEISYYDAQKIINKIMKVTLNIPENHLKFIEIQNVIFNKIYEKYIPKYDKKDDNVYGIFGDVYHLPKIEKRKTEQVIKIHITYDKQVQDLINEEEINDTICQHYVDWMNMLLVKSKGDSKYSDMLYEFMQTYVIVNEEFENVCKSCGCVLQDTKKYVADGVYDASTQKFVSFSIPMEVSLEDIPEYKKYNIAIRNIDRLIDKIATIVNIPYLIGSSLTQKIKRSSVVKDTIDIVTTNNAILIKNYAKRNETESEKYGIDRGLSYLFAFSLDNNIFIFASKEEKKDFYKYLKYDNIIAYIIFLILLELNESHIAFLSIDKVCNFNSFVKFGEKMLYGLKIKINKSGDIKNITDYPVLSYLIYVITCTISKYGIWYTIEFDENKRLTKSVSQIQQKKSGIRKIDPIKQKHIIHTVVDIMNCVINYAEENKSKHIYEIILSKYYQKLATLYSNNAIIEQLREENIKNLPQFLKGVTKEQVAFLDLTSSYIPMEQENIEFNKYNISKFYPQNNELYNPKLEITNQYYCKNGIFHAWKLYEKTMKCSLCGILAENNEFEENATKEVKINERKHYLEKVCDKYCLSGELHVFRKHINKEGKESDVCKNCEYIRGIYPSIQKMEEIYAIVSNPKILKRIDKLEKRIDKHNEIAKNIINELKKQFVDTKNYKDEYYKFIEKFINILMQNVGDIIKFDEKTIQLKENMYIIDHNHLGFPMNPPLIISENSNMIYFKKNNSFFNTDTISYNIGKSTKIEVFYDMFTHVLLGYKEFNKEYVLNVKTENKINIEYSLINQIKYLGNSSIYIDISNITNDNEQNMLSKIIRDLNFERIDNIGNIIHQFVVCINTIKNKVNKFNNKNEKNIDDEIIPIIDITKYYNKLNGIVINVNENTIFNNWKIIIQNIRYNEQNVKLKTINIKNKILQMDDVYTYDYSGNLALIYFISEIIKLIDMNKNKIVQQNLLQFIIEFINAVFLEYNKEHLNDINELQRFICILNSSEYFRKLEEKGFGIDEYTSGIYGEYTDPSVTKSKEEIIAEDEAVEEMESTDVDNDVDAEDNYDTAFEKQERFPLTRWNIEIKNPF
jgi:hypothetical protein